MKYFVELQLIYASVLFNAGCYGHNLVNSKPVNDVGSDILVQRVRRAAHDEAGTLPKEGVESLIRCGSLDDYLEADPQFRCSPKYFACIGGIGRERACETSKYFDPEQGRCDFYWRIFECTLRRLGGTAGPVTPQTTTTRPTTTTRQPRKEHNQEIRFQPKQRYSFDCQSRDDDIYPTGLCEHTYWICLGGATQLSTCPNDLYFDAELKVCSHNWTIATCESIIASQEESGGHSPGRGSEGRHSAGAHSVGGHSVVGHSGGGRSEGGHSGGGQSVGGHSAGERLPSRGNSAGGHSSGRHSGASFPDSHDVGQHDQNGHAGGHPHGPRPVNHSHGSNFGHNSKVPTSESRPWVHQSNVGGSRGHDSNFGPRNPEPGQERGRGEHNNRGQGRNQHEQPDFPASDYEDFREHDRPLPSSSNFNSGRSDFDSSRSGEFDSNASRPDRFDSEPSKPVQQFKTRGAIEAQLPFVPNSQKFDPHRNSNRDRSTQDLEDHLSRGQSHHSQIRPPHQPHPTPALPRVNIHRPQVNEGDYPDTFRVPSAHIRPATTPAPAQTTTKYPQPTTVNPEVFNCFLQNDGNYEAAPCEHFFYSCAAGTGYVMKCPANLVYDTKEMVCNLAVATPSCHPPSEEAPKQNEPTEDSGNYKPDENQIDYPEFGDSFSDDPVPKVVTSQDTDSVEGKKRSQR